MDNETLGGCIGAIIGIIVIIAIAAFFHLFALAPAVS